MTQRDLSAWLPTLLGPVDLQANGEPWPSRRKIWNFTGGVTVTDHPNDEDPLLSYTEIAIDGGVGSTEGPTLANADTGTINNVVSTASGTPAAAIRFSGVAPTVTGIASGADKRKLVLFATGGPLVLANESGSSTDINRIITGVGASVIVPDESAVILVYDPTSLRWRLASGVGSQAITILNDDTGAIHNIASTSDGGAIASGIRFSGAAPDVSGIAGGADPRTLVLIATGGPLILRNEDSDSTAANRIITGTGGDLTIPDEYGVTLRYDAVSSRWRVLRDGASSIETPLTVPNGGTGATSLTSGRLLVGGGVGAITAAAQHSVNGGGLHASSTGYYTYDSESNVASLGYHRLAYGTHNWLLSRNAANDGDYYAIRIINNTLYIGGPGSSTSVFPNVHIASESLRLYGVTGPGTINEVLRITSAGAQFFRGVVNTTAAVGALAIDWATANVFTKTLSAGGNTFTFSNAADGQVIIVVLTGAASTVTWPTVKWAGGVAPTQTASGIDVYTFVKAGSTIYGSVVQAMA